MKIEKLKLKNFRGYHDEVSIKFGNFTAFVGKNDIGKSTILEALDIFFNDTDAINKIDKTDLNVDARNRKEEEKDQEISIAVCFSDLPEQIVIDATNKTTLKAEYLLNEDSELEIVKKYKNGSSSAKVFIRAMHPTNPSCKNLMQMKDDDLRRIIASNNIDCDNKSVNAVMRSAIWKYFDNKEGLQLDTAEIEVATKGGDTKSIWEKLQTYLPLYSLFQSDRKNTDGDSEVQDPLKEAVKEILTDNTLQQKLNEVAATVEAKLKDVANRTLDKLSEMDPDVAKTLQPIIPPAESLKWQDVFRNVSIASDENIPINKRGSGVKRLILLNFFRAEVERRQDDTNAANVIYAIEEPETSQHSENQKKLIKALSQLAETNGVQVIITTHSPTIVKKLDFANIRIVSKDNEGARKIIDTPQPQSLPYRSLNEVNYIAFSEISEEYHNELFGHIKACGWLGLYKQHKKTFKYITARFDKKGNDITNPNKPDYLTKTEIIRNQIHHPENKHNTYHFTEDELRTSIEEMRKFIQAQYSKTDQQE